VAAHRRARGRSARRGGERRRLPSRYKKQDEASHKIINHMLRRELGSAPLKTLITRDSKTTLGIQLADLFLGATLADWQGDYSAAGKREVAREVARHLGWPDTRADTYRDEAKFNIWHFHDPTTKVERETKTRRVELLYPMHVFKRR